MGDRYISCAPESGGCGLSLAHIPRGLYSQNVPALYMGNGIFAMIPFGVSFKQFPEPLMTAYMSIDSAFILCNIAPNKFTNCLFTVWSKNSLIR